jgi:ArsR family transcriptional regulator
MKDKYSDFAFLFKALSDANRLLILDYLKDGERCACVILEQLHITQSTLSYHMKMLTDCDIVLARREGKWMHYSLNQNKLNEVMDFISVIQNGINEEFPKC